METKTLFKNWEQGTSSEILETILQDNVNIAIYNRGLEACSEEIDNLLRQDIKLNLSGDINSILDQTANTISLDNYPLLFSDIEYLLSLFKKITKANSFKLFLATVNTNMCKRFHTDNNNLRLLCTYSGPGTLWLEEENVNRVALNALKSNKSIVIDTNKIQQAPTGAVVILKGSKYHNNDTKAIVHRSPTIEETGLKRLLLRIDTNEFLNF